MNIAAVFPLKVPSAQIVLGDEPAVVQSLERRLGLAVSRFRSIKELRAFGGSLSKDLDAILIANALFRDQESLAGMLGDAEKKYGVAGSNSAAIASTLKLAAVLRDQIAESRAEGNRLLDRYLDQLRRLNRQLASGIRHLKRAVAQARPHRFAEWRRTALSWLAVLIPVAAVVFIAVHAYINLSLSQFRVRLSDFQAIAAALDRYKADNGSYPASENHGQDWNGIGWKGDQTAWIQGLVPSYMHALPIDPRKTKIPHAQYIYRSDGRDYKLIVLLPEDCALATWRNPGVSDPARNNPSQCVAYGIWTPGARAW